MNGEQSPSTYRGLGLKIAGPVGGAHERMVGPGRLHLAGNPESGMFIERGGLDRRRADGGRAWPLSSPDYSDPESPREKNIGYAHTGPMALGV